MGISNGLMTVKKNTNWTSAENVTLMNALKAFPKDVTMRWENIAA